MSTLVFFNSIQELFYLTGNSDINNLNQNGFDLTDFKFGFMVNDGKLNQDAWIKKPLLELLFKPHIVVEYGGKSWFIFYNERE